MIAEKQYDVFISYAHKDYDKVSPIYSFLKTNNIECFIDEEEISGGSPWKVVIDQALHNSQLLLFIFSRNCLKGNGIRREIKAELRKASEIKIPIIPLALDFNEYNRITIDLLRGISAIQYYEKNPDRHYKNLLNSIQKTIKPLNYIRTKAIKGFADLEKSANKGDSDSQIKIGDYFHFGKKLEVDLDVAIKFYMKAANNGNECSYGPLGYCYLDMITEALESQQHGYDSIGQLFEVYRHKNRAEDWFQKLANSPLKDITGLLDLFERVNPKEGSGLLCSLWKQFIPNEESFKIFYNIQIEDSSISFRLCRLMYSYTLINTMNEQGEIDRIIDEPISVLEKMAEEKQDVNAMLFLASTYYNLRPESCGIESYSLDNNRAMAVKYLNMAYDTAKDDLLRYDLSEYGLLSENTSLSYILQGLLSSRVFNPIGIQFCRCIWGDKDLIEWENLKYLSSQTDSSKYYYLGLAALNVNLSFAARWLTMSSRLGNTCAKALLGDYFSEHLVLYRSGCKITSGEIDNIISHFKHGVSTGDELLDKNLELYLKQPEGIKKAWLADRFIDNTNKAYENYIKANDLFCIGRCNYLGLGVDVNRDYAKKLGYTDEAAQNEDNDFISLVDAANKRKCELNKLFEELDEREEYDYMEEDEAPIPFTSEDDTSLNDWYNNKLSEYENKRTDWIENYPGIPCPYDYLIKEL